METDGTMKGKTCLVTGATSGIGEITARELARMGARVVVVGRSAERCGATLDRIRSETGSDAVESMVADLSVQSEVRRLAAEVRDRLDRLDVLVNNAGGMLLERRASADGIEMTLALNHFSYFLLTQELLPLLKASAPARVVNVASEAHRGGRIDFDDLGQERRKYGGWRAYQQSKLANILFTDELARRLEGTGVTANSLHPGFVRTRFFSEFTGWMGFLFNAIAPFAAISPEAGAKTTIHLASSPEVQGVSGRYFDKCKPAVPSREAQNRVTAERLWKVSEEMIGAGSERNIPAPDRL